MGGVVALGGGVVQAVGVLDAGLPHQVRPFGFGLRLGGIELQISGDIE